MIRHRITAVRSEQITDFAWVIRPLQKKKNLIYAKLEIGLFSTRSPEIISFQRRSNEIESIFVFFVHKANRVPLLLNWYRQFERGLIGSHEVLAQPKRSSGLFSTQLIK